LLVKKKLKGQRKLENKKEENVNWLVVKWLMKRKKSLEKK
jgi:hypothetical protein